MVRKWADNRNFNGKIAYIFEAGHRDQPEANRMMNDLVKKPLVKALARYGSHTFMGKCDAAPLQSADLLAWLVSNWFNRRLTKKEDIKRKDLHALLTEAAGHQSFSIHQWSEPMLIQSFIDSANRMRSLGYEYYAYAPPS